MTNAECRAEALRLLAESNRVFAEYLDTAPGPAAVRLYEIAAHHRQIGGALAALAGPEPSDAR